MRRWHEALEMQKQVVGEVSANRSNEKAEELYDKVRHTAFDSPAISTSNRIANFSFPTASLHLVAGTRGSIALLTMAWYSTLKAVTVTVFTQAPSYHPL